MPVGFRIYLVSSISFRVHYEDIVAHTESEGLGVGATMRGAGTSLLFCQSRTAAAAASQLQLLLAINQMIGGCLETPLTASTVPNSGAGY